MEEEIFETDLEEKRPKYSYVIYFGIVLAVLILLAVVSLYFLTTAPRGQQFPILLEVESGMSVRSVAALAKENNLVRSELLLYTILTAYNDPTNIHAGNYRFEEPVNSFAVAQKIASNEVDEILVSITIPEGVTARKIAEIASEQLPDFDSDEFIASATKDEGFLFPDTYFVPETFTAADLHRLQKNTFAEKVRPIELAAGTTDFEESRSLLVLASIIEREANSEESMKMVSGILKNRLELGMLLQADASIEYVLDTPINELRPGQLAQILKENDSPYNTYKHTGLPPTPIGNPGLTAIDAAFNPTPSEYLFYITGRDGEFYYAKTLTEHNQNVANHLR